MADRARAAGLALRDDHLRPTRKPGREERRLGKEIRPDVNARPGKSYKGLYRLLERYEREFVDPDRPEDTKDCVALASTATARTDYSPANLEQYLAAGGPVAEVTLPQGDSLALT